MLGDAEAMDAAGHADSVGMGHGRFDSDSFFDQGKHAGEIAAVVENFGEGVEALDVA